MSVTYLLPCHGDSTVEVGQADAGRSVDCPCGKSVVVPTLRELQKLPRIQSGAPQATTPAWTLQQGITFSSGAAVMCIGLFALSMLTYWYWQLNTKRPTYDESAVAEAYSHLTPVQALDLWGQFQKAPPLESRLPPAYLVNRNIAKWYRIYMAVCGGIIGIGLAVAAWGVLKKPARRRKPSGRKKPKENRPVAGKA